MAIRKYSPIFRLKSESDELMALDFLRIIASVGVVVYHYSYYAWVPHQLSALRLDHSFARQWVDLFFVVSGFVIAYVYADRIQTWSNYRDFMQKRVARLVPLHWATLAFFVLVGLVATAGIHADTMERFDWSCLAPNFLLLHAFGTCSRTSFNDVSWSISAEMGMYLLFPVLAKVAAYTRGWAMLILAVTLIVLLSAVTWNADGVEHKFWLSWGSHFGAIRALPSFAFGVALYHARHLLARLPGAECLMLLSLIGFVILGAIGANPLVTLGIVYVLVSSAVGLDMQKGASAPIRRIGVFGQLTYSIYMLHLPIATVVMTFGKRVLHLEGPVINLWIIMTFALMILVSFFSLHYFEQPLRRYISGRRTRARAPVTA